VNKADKIADYSEFFSFGTNDLTRRRSLTAADDAEQVLLDTSKGYQALNPYQSSDEDGVGYLISRQSKRVEAA